MNLITLSKPSKMPCPSYSIPATRCKTGSKLARIPGSVCSACYALKGNYYFPNVKRALESRYHALKDPAWVDTMVKLITPHQYFRWHDSGDLQGVWHLRKIVQVCQNTPDTQHWLPTKEPTIIRQFLKRGGSIPDNLIIRISAGMIDSHHYTHVPGCLGSGVVTTGASCPAPQQGNQCRDCRRCWDTSVQFVTYAKH